MLAVCRHWISWIFIQNGAERLDIDEFVYCCSVECQSFAVRFRILYTHEIHTHTMRRAEVCACNSWTNQKSFGVRGEFRGTVSDFYSSDSGQRWRCWWIDVIPRFFLGGMNGTICWSIPSKLRWVSRVKETHRSEISIRSILKPISSNLSIFFLVNFLKTLKILRQSIQYGFWIQRLTQLKHL